MTRISSAKRGLLLGVILTAVVGAMVFGVSVVMDQPCTRVEIRGAHQSDATELARMAHPTAEQSEEAVIANRVRRHPWVRWSSATCYPTGVLQVAVEERVPVLLAFTDNGVPAYFIDPAGFMMPVPGNHAVDVPLLRDASEPFHPVRPMESTEIRALAQALAQLDRATERLLTEFTRTPRGLTLHLAPENGHQSVEVWLGRENLVDRLEMVRTLWESWVSANPAKTVRVIDLRFDGQMVTWEEPAQPLKNTAS